MSRLPVGRVFRHLLPAPPDSSVPSMQRGCLEVEVAASGGALRIPVHASRVLLEEAATGAGDASRRPAAGGRGAGAHCRSAAAAPAPVDLRPARARRSGGAVWRHELRTGQRRVSGDRWGRRRGAGVVRRLDAVPPGVAHAPTVGLHGAEWPDRAYCCDFLLPRRRSPPSRRMSAFWPRPPPRTTSRCCWRCDSERRGYAAGRISVHGLAAAGKLHAASREDLGRVEQRNRSAQRGVELDQWQLGAAEDDGLGAALAKMFDRRPQVLAALARGVACLDPRSP